MEHVSVENLELDEIPWQLWSEAQWDQWEADHRSWPMQADWSVPPVETLLEWGEEQGLAPEELRRRLTADGTDLIRLLDDPPAALTPEHAALLETLTDIPARIWKRQEARYRVEMARLAKLAEMREALGPAVSAGEMLKRWADEHDPRLEQLNELFLGDEAAVYAILTNRHRLTPDDVLLLAALTGIACVLWAEQQAAYWIWVAQQEEV